jgi:hypothetical protein
VLGEGMMDSLVLAAATAVVTAMATDGWQVARRAMVKLWRRVQPEHVPAIESELDDTHAEITAARRMGQTSAEEPLVAYWQLKLQRLLNSSPELEAALRRMLDEVLMPLLPADDQVRIQNVQNITASAPGATAQGAMFGNVINYEVMPPATTGDSSAVQQTQKDEQ